MLYPKINSIYKRDPATKFKTFLPEYSEPEFELLARLPWDATEKIDGTNIRVMWDGSVVTFGGRTEKAQLPAQLVAHLQTKFTAEAFLSHEGPDPYPPMVLFGEGYGAGIQKGGDYRADQGFILFDVVIGRWWLEWDSVLDFARRFDVPAVPFVGKIPLPEAERMAMDGFKSFVGNCPSEGLVLRAPLGLKNRAGGRIITKVKTADYRG